MTGQEKAVCYPQFFRLPDGDLLFLYRTGTSGAGDLSISRYSVKTGQWHVPPGPIVAGEGQRNAYWQTAVDPRRDLLDCHPEPSRSKLHGLLASGQLNAYTIEKAGQKKLVYQAPWYVDGEYRGLIELVLPLPDQLPHFVRDNA